MITISSIIARVKRGAFEKEIHVASNADYSQPHIKVFGENNNKR